MPASAVVYQRGHGSAGPFRHARKRWKQRQMSLSSILGSTGPTANASTHLCSIWNEPLGEPCAPNACQGTQRQPSLLAVVFDRKSCRKENDSPPTPMLSMPSIAKSEHGRCQPSRL